MYNKLQRSSPPTEPLVSAQEVLYSKLPSHTFQCHCNVHSAYEKISIIFNDVYIYIIYDVARRRKKSKATVYVV